MSKFIPRAAVEREWKKQAYRKTKQASTPIRVQNSLELPTPNPLEVPK